MALDESEVLTIPVTRDTDYEFKLAVKDDDREPEPLDTAEEIVFLIKRNEEDLITASTNIVAALHSLGGTGAYVDTGGETLDFAAAGNTITRSAGDFTVDNFAVGDWIRVKGTALNDGSYKVQGVAALVLTLETTDPAKLAIAPSVVDEAGVSGAAVTITVPVLAAGDLERGVVAVSGPPSDMAGEDLGTFYGSARILRADGKVHQAPRRSARIRLES